MDMLCRMHANDNGSHIRVTQIVIDAKNLSDERFLGSILRVIDKGGLVTISVAGERPSEFTFPT